MKKRVRLPNRRTREKRKSHRTRHRRLFASMIIERTPGSALAKTSTLTCLMRVIATRAFAGRLTPPGWSAAMPARLLMHCTIFL
jgi:hypothetical protein